MISTHLSCLLVLVLFTIASFSHGFKRHVPKMCCSPNQFTADLKNTMTTHRHYTSGEQPTIAYVYDYTNRRWGFHDPDPNNSTRFSRVAFDYDNNWQLYQNEEKCQITKMSATMKRHCIRANASFDGVYNYGDAGHTLPVYQWSYDLGKIPIRSVRLVTKYGCYPVTDLSGIVVRNTWDWTEGDPPCNPWEEPHQLLKGNCYKSFKKHVTPESVVEFSVPLVTVEYRNMELGVTKPEIFDVPDNCQSTDIADWGDETRLDDVFRMMLYWFNPHDPYTRRRRRRSK